MRRFILGGTRGQALVEYALGIVLVAFAGVTGTMLFGPSIKAHIAADYQTTWPEVRFAGLNVVVNPTDRATHVATSTSLFTATATIPPTSTQPPTMTTAPTLTLTPTATTAPTFTSTPTFTPFPTLTFTATPTYREWCIAMGYNWKPLTGLCKFGGVVMTPPP